MHREHKELMDRLSSNRDEMIERLIRWCNVNTGSYHLSNLSTFTHTLMSSFESLAGRQSIIEMPSVSQVKLSGEQYLQTFGNALLIEKRPDAPYQVALCGHMDTVFPQHSSFKDCRWLDSKIINGPGVADMKGGLLVILYALQAFEQSDLAEKVGWKVFINADEEVGSLGSASFLSLLAKQVNVGLVYEPSMTAEGAFAGERKGSAKFSFVAKGISAHAGRDFNKGRNAICYLSDVILKLNELNGQQEGVTLNVGLIQGGSALNVVADTAVAKVDIRYKTLEQQQWLELKLSSIVQSFNSQSGYSLELSGGFSRAPKPMTVATAQLFSKVEAICNQLGLPYDTRPSGGCCDGNNLQAEGIPIIDTLGVCGGKIHSEDEFILVDSLVERTMLSTMLLLELAREPI